MTPSELVAALIAKSGKSLTEVAVEIAGRGFQGTLYKFVHHGTRSPRNETAVRIAKYFGLPFDALFDKAVATKVAVERGLTYSPAPPPPADSVGEPIRIPPARPPAHRKLPARTLQRIADLNPKQFNALEHMIESYLDTVAPVSETAKKSA